MSMNMAVTIKSICLSDANFFDQQVQALRALAC